MFLFCILLAILQSLVNARLEAYAGVDPCHKHRCEEISTKLYNKYPSKIVSARFHGAKRGKRQRKSEDSWTVHLENGPGSVSNSTIDGLSNSIDDLPFIKHEHYYQNKNNNKNSITKRKMKKSRRRKRKHKITRINSDTHLIRKLHRFRRATQARTVLQIDYIQKRNKIQGCHKYAVFKVFEIDFVLCLILGSFLDDPILASNPDLSVSIYGNGTDFRERSISSMYLQIAEGHLIGQDFSSVRGYVWRDKFYGCVRTHKYILQIEPLSNSGPVVTRYSSTKNRVLNAYVYRVMIKSRDTKLKKSYFSKKKNQESFKSKMTNEYYKKKFKKSKENEVLKGEKESRFNWGNKVKRSTNSGDELKSCSLLLIADHTFFKKVGEESVKQTVLQMIYHAREANIILRNLDLDGKRIGIHVAGIGVITSQDHQDYLLKGKFKSPEKYLTSFSRYQFDGYCLSVLLSNQKLGKNVLGLSWRGNIDRGAGVCQLRRKVRSRHKGQVNMNLNSLFITLRTRRSDRIPLRMGVLNLAHEILHSFGVDHDNSSCEQDENTHGRFLMSKYAGTGLDPNNEKISNCTKQNLRESVANTRQSYCLHTASPEFCGNGKVEGGEECDCGDIETCLQTRSCCTPPGLRNKETACTWRKHLKVCQNKEALSENEFLNLVKHSKNSLLNFQKSNSLQKRLKQKRYKKSKYRNEKLCKIVDLKSCSCLSGCNCCRTNSGYCKQANTIIQTFFSETQKLVENCGYPVLHCLYGSYIQNPYLYLYREQLKEFNYTSVLKKLNLLKPDKKGKIFCLKSRSDSNCWQIDVGC